MKNNKLTRILLALVTIATATLSPAVIAEGNHDRNGHRNKPAPRGYHWEDREYKVKTQHHSGCRDCEPGSGVQRYSDGITVNGNMAGEILSVPQFPSTPVMVLTGVKLERSVWAISTNKAENTGGGTSTITIIEDVKVELIPPTSLPDLSSLSETYSAVYSETVGAFDGILDFDGTSGFTLMPFIFGKNVTAVDIANIGAFDGIGTVNFLVNSTATTAAYGSGNLHVWFMTYDGADVGVTYAFKVLCPDRPVREHGEDDHDDDSDHDGDSCHKTEYSDK